MTGSFDRLAGALAPPPPLGGHCEKAGALYAELAARARSEYAQPAALAVAAVGAGRRADVIRHLGEAEDTRDPLLSLMASHWPGFSNELRSDPGFVAVLRRMGWDRPIEVGKPETDGVSHGG